MLFSLPTVPRICPLRKSSQPELPTFHSPLARSFDYSRCARYIPRGSSQRCSYPSLCQASGFNLEPAFPEEPVREVASQPADERRIGAQPPEPIAFPSGGVKGASCRVSWWPIVERKQGVGDVLCNEVPLALTSGQWRGNHAGQSHYGIGSTVQEFIHYVRSAVDRLALRHESRDSSQVIAGGH